MKDELIRELESKELEMQLLLQKQKSVSNDIVAMSIIELFCLQITSAVRLTNPFFLNRAKRGTRACGTRGEGQGKTWASEAQ